MLPANQQIIATLPLFVKTAMVNVAPVVWLFYLQSSWSIRFDGPVFWISYGVLSIIIAGCMWFTNKSTPDPTYVSDTEIPTPLTGIVSATFQPLMFAAVIGMYIATT